MEEYFKDKKVVVLGPANYLEMISEETKKQIKKSDTVVRVNRGFDLIEKYSSVIGSRTDILYNNLIGDCVNGGVLNLKKIVESQIKHIRTVPKSDMKGIATSNTVNIKNMEIYNVIRDLSTKHSINTSIVECDYFTAISKKINCRPTTGFVALLDILRYSPKNLYVTGYSFYLGGVFKGYFGGSSPGGIVETFGRTEDEEINRNFNSTRHVHKDMWHYCKRNISTLDNVVFDPVLVKILSMNDFSKENYKKIIENYSKTK